MPVTDVIQQLLIVKGVAPAVGDTASAEQGLTSVDLLTQNQQSGWSLDAENGWNPAIPALKGGGVWADSAVSSGRQLLSNEEGNVLETMQLTVIGNTVPDLAAHLSKMSKMIQAARDFWATFFQIEPIYLKWHAVGAPGPQYALIYNIEMAIVEPEIYSATVRDITLTIEREPYWRGIAPGANPKLWKLTKDGTQPTTANQAFSASAGNIKTETLQNRREWNTTQTAVVSDNTLTIPAADIPGDAPALVSLYAVPANSPGTTTRLFIYQTSKPQSYLARNGGTRRAFQILNAGDANVGTDTTIAADTGAPQSNSVAAGRRTQTTFATATEQRRVYWRLDTETAVDMASFRGRYACFLRTRLSASSTVTMRLRFAGEDPSVVGYVTLPLQTFVDATAGGTGNTSQWSVVYMGQISLPFDNRRTSVGQNGLGQWIPNDPAYNLGIELLVARTGGATNMYVADLIMIPIDETGIELALPSLSSAYDILYDNTGYITHGVPESGAILVADSGTAVPNAQGTAIEIIGQDLTLQPGVDNTIGILLVGTNLLSQIDWTVDFGLSLVPRWRGVRDV